MSDQLSLVCQTAEQGYGVGDEYFLTTTSLYYVAGAIGQGVAISADATNIYIRQGSDGYVFSGLHKTSGNVVPLINAKWKLHVRAWAL